MFDVGEVTKEKREKETSWKQPSPFINISNISIVIIIYDLSISATDADTLMLFNYYYTQCLLPLQAG
ncbi:hypothetical protein RJT34_13044 [Clitoria ternatea]|uniref:Uncharacterized protein n=1 Tax=Clitoria ternatea TaxID=43366 RepID=A0AAN9PLC5_CLITE